MIALVNFLLHNDIIYEYYEVIEVNLKLISETVNINCEIMDEYILKNITLICNGYRDLIDVGYDFIRFTSFKYIKAGLQVIGKESAASRIFKDKITEIMLPMLPNISESNSVDWGGDKANAIQLALGNRAAQGIEAIGDLSMEKLLFLSMILIF